MERLQEELERLQAELAKALELYKQKHAELEAHLAGQAKLLEELNRWRIEHPMTIDQCSHEKDQLKAQLEILQGEIKELQVLPIQLNAKIKEISLKKDSRYVVWEHEQQLGSGLWVQYDEEISDAIEKQAVTGIAHKAITMEVHDDVDPYTLVKSDPFHNHRAMVDPHKRLHINMDTGANLKCRRRKKFVRYETVPHNDPIKRPENESSTPNTPEQSPRSPKAKGRGRSQSTARGTPP